MLGGLLVVRQAWAARNVVKTETVCWNLSSDGSRIDIWLNGLSGSLERPENSVHSFEAPPNEYDMWCTRAGLYELLELKDCLPLYKILTLLPPFFNKGTDHEGTESTKTLDMRYKEIFLIWWRHEAVSKNQEKVDSLVRSVKFYNKTFLQRIKQHCNARMYTVSYNSICLMWNNNGMGLFLLQA